MSNKFIITDGFPIEMRKKLYQLHLNNIKTQYINYISSIFTQWEIFFRGVCRGTNRQLTMMIVVDGKAGDELTNHH